jgi:protein-tyrosine phosphatase
MDSTGPIFGTSRRTASDADANDGPGPGESLEPAGRSTDNRNVRVLFICTANRIRSPFAEAVATRLVDEHRLPVDISSAGVTSAGEEAAESMVHAASKFNLDLSGHRSRLVSSDMIEESDLIVTMTGRHILTLMNLNPAARTNAVTLREWAAAVQVDDTPADLAAAPEWAARSSAATTAGVPASPGAAAVPSVAGVSGVVGVPVPAGVADSSSGAAGPAWTPNAVRLFAQRLTDRPVDVLLSSRNDIADPIGRSQRQFRNTAREIDRLIRVCFGVGPS